MGGQREQDCGETVASVKVCSTRAEFVHPTLINAECTALTTCQKY